MAGGTDHAAVLTQIIERNMRSRLHSTKAAATARCTGCGAAMNIGCTEYNCANCGRTKRRRPTGLSADAISSSIKVTSGGRSGKVYNITTDVARTQRKMLLDHIHGKAAAYTGAEIPDDIVVAAVAEYNRIQRFVTEDVVAHGEVVGQKKFVRRGCGRDEVVAALISDECERRGVVRRKRDIANFIGLPTEGFCRGEAELRDLAADGKYELPPKADPITMYVDRYATALGITAASYLKFIAELVSVSEQRKICMTSQLSSKVVGAIWVLITKLRLGITAETVERHTDNTKRNTFIKFYSAVIAAPGVFASIFIKHGIPL